MYKLVKHSLLFLTINITSSFCYCQNQYLADKTEKIIRSINQYHYSPRIINDEFSQLLYENFIERLATKDNFFSNEDVKLIAENKNNFDDFIISKDFSFIENISELYNQRLNLRIQFLENLSLKCVTWNKNDSLFIFPKDSFLTKTNTEKHLEQELKYQTLNYYFYNHDSTPIADLNINDSLEILHKEIIKKEICHLKSKQNYSDIPQRFVSDQFLKSLACTFDPHTNFFTPIENDFFNRSISTDNLSYGMNFQMNELGEVEIAEVIPGSPAWDSNQINEGDVLIEIQRDNKEKLSINCMNVYAAIESIYSNNINNTTFTIRKKSGEIINIDLTKKSLQSEDNIIKSFLLGNENKIGYIYLPSFYTNANSYYSEGCANDIAKELIKLKQEEISGLIIDLRNNSGGSMLEAINLAGMFVNYGALGVYDIKTEGPSTLKDLNRGTIFNKPLLILQNSYSASASELFATAMQDYNRAIIVGSPSFGKSTVQQIFPLDTANSQLNSGYLKITIGKFYRINGHTHQKYGVNPDINLPTLNYGKSAGEKNYPTALINDTINKKIYAYPLAKLPIDTIARLSYNRLNTVDFFKQIRQYNKMISNIDETKIPLNIDSFSEYYESQRSLLSFYNNPDTTYTLNVKNPRYIRDLRLTIDGKPYNTTAIENIKNDAYITESFRILADLINIK